MKITTLSNVVFAVCLRPSVAFVNSDGAEGKGSTRSNGTWQSVVFSIASCHRSRHDSLSWALPLLAFGDVVVMEQCSTGPYEAWRSWGYKVELVAQRCGHDSHSVMRFIINHWGNLPDHIVFLQGDAPGHFGVSSENVKLR